MIAVPQTARGTNPPARSVHILVLSVFCLALLISSATAIDFFDTVNTTGDLPTNQTVLFSQWVPPFNDFLFEFVPGLVARGIQGGQGAFLCILFIGGIGIFGRIFA